MDVNPSFMVMLVGPVASENLDDGGAGASVHERHQDLVAHTVAVLDHVVAHNDSSQVKDNLDGDCLDILVSLNLRRLVAIDTDHAENFRVKTCFFLGGAVFNLFFFINVFFSFSFFFQVQ